MHRDPFSPLVKRDIVSRSFSTSISWKMFKYERIFTLHRPLCTGIVMVFLVGERCTVSLEALTGVTHS